MRDNHHAKMGFIESSSQNVTRAWDIGPLYMREGGTAEKKLRFGDRGIVGGKTLAK